MTTPLHGGPGYLLQGLRLLNHPRIRWFVLGPILINLVLFVLLTWFAIDQFSSLLIWMTDKIPSWLSFIAWLFWIFFGGFLLLIYGYSFAIIGNILASPFYGPLAERVEELLTGNEHTSTKTAKQTLALAGRSITREFIKLGYFLPRIIGVLILTLILSFIPVLNLLGPAIAFFWGAWSLALQYIDYPADNNQTDFRELRKQLREKRLISISFGGSVLIATTIPILNLFTMPASVIGATVFWLERMPMNRGTKN
ncbi:MAG: sulfate transporter CysZ [Porticoccaceae bacterium]|nr:MAG: sulfate transporter CysZ [Porticoccaceae bacterium]